jgi:hypothetical protein
LYRDFKKRNWLWFFRWRSCSYGFYVILPIQFWRISFANL